MKKPNVSDRGKPAAEVVRRGLRAPTPTRVENGFVVFDVPPDSPPVTLQLVNRLRDEVEDRAAGRKDRETA